MDNTIGSESNIGQMLNKIRKNELLMLSYQGKSFPINGKLIIGRDRGCHIPVEDKLASRQHALIQKIKDAYFIKDLNSTNGTSVNGNPLPEDKYVRLRRGDRLQIGRTELVIN